jgi:hypothetical protein
MLTFLALFLTAKSFAQLNTEAFILGLSKEIFRYETKVNSSLPLMAIRQLTTFRIWKCL